MRYILSVFIFLCANIFVFSQSEIYKVGLLLDKSTVEVDGLLESLIEEVSAVVGEDAILEFPNTSILYNNFDAATALRNYKALVQNDIDIIIAFGTVNNSVISKIGTYQKPTIVFGTLSEELLGSDKSGLSDVTNYISITTSQSYSEDLKLFKELVNPNRIGVVVEKALIDNIPIAETFEAIGDDLNIEMTIIPFDTLTDVISNLNTIDGLYLVGGFYFTDTEIKELADTLIEKQIPSFTVNLKDVSNGILATNHEQSELNQYFRRIALTVESVVNGSDLLGLSTKIDSRRTLTVNYTTAEKIGLPLKYSLIATTRFTGDPKGITADKTYSLVDVMQEAIAENLQLQTKEYDINLVEKEVQLAKSNYLPNVDVGVTGSYIDPKLAVASNGQNPEMSTSGRLLLQQTLFSETANATISIQKFLRDAQKENYNSDVLNTVFNAATAYFTALILKENFSIQNQNLELTKYNLKIAEENYEAGQAGRSDVLRFKSEMAQNTQQMIEAVNQLEQSYYALNQLLNNPIDFKIDVEDAELKTGVFNNYNYERLGQFLDDPVLRQPFVNFLVQEAIDNAPELKALEYNLKATERSERLYGAGRFLPTVVLQGQYNYEFSRSGAGSDFLMGFSSLPNDYYTFGLNISLPIFNQNRQNVNRQISSIQKEQLEISKDNLKLNIEKNINDSVLELINQISNIQLSKVFEETAKEALDLTQTSYASGAVNIVQLLDAQNNYVQAQQASANANYNYLQGAMQLERALGLFFLLQDNNERDAFVNRFQEFIRNND